MLSVGNETQGESSTSLSLPSFSRNAHHVFATKSKEDKNFSSSRNSAYLSHHYSSSQRRPRFPPPGSLLESRLLLPPSSPQLAPLLRDRQDQVLLPRGYRRQSPFQHRQLSRPEETDSVKAQRVYQLGKNGFEARLDRAGELQSSFLPLLILNLT